MPVLVPAWVAGVVDGDLSVLLGTPRVAALPLANFSPAYQGAINIQRFESVTVETLWVVHKSSGGALQSGRTVASEPVTGYDYAALAAAHSRALAKVSGDIAAVIRAEADAK